MKKLSYFIVAVCFILPLLTAAQTEKGSILLGVSSRMGVTLYGTYGVGSGADLMSFGFSTIRYKSDDDEEESAKEKLIGINLSPRIGFFPVKNLVGGLDLNLASWTSKMKDPDYKTTITLFNAGPFLRYYIPAGKVMPFLEGYAYWGVVSTKESGEDEWDYDSKYSNNVYGGGAGIAFPIGNRSSFDFMLCYSSNSMKEKEDNEDNERTVTGTLGIRFGFVYILGKKD